MKTKLLYIIAALAVILLLISIEIRHQTDIQHIGELSQQNEALTAQNQTLQQDIATLQDTVDKQTQEILQLTNEIEHIQSQPKESEAQKTNRSGDRLISLGTYTVTAYCSCEKCCGKYAKNRPGGKVYGANGTELHEGVSVAAWLPFGTKLKIGGKVYTVQDRTAKWVKEKYNSRIIDLYYSDHAEAWNWGKQELEVWVME